MNIFITGGAGFIGSHLAERCLSEGWSVSVLDDLSTGSFENIARLRSCKQFCYTIDSVFNMPLVSELVDCCDLVFHLAAAVGVQLVVESPVNTIETNVRGTETVLRAAAKKKKRVILASTSEVYGKSLRVPFQEDDDLVMGSTTKGRWSYACSKALDEFLGLAYFHEKRVPVSVVRFFNTVGPRQTARYGMVLPTFINQALANRPITVFGDGSQTRCFGYVGDAVEALVRIAKSPRVAGEIVNIGSDSEISIRELASVVRRRTNSRSEIVYVPYADAYGPGFEDMFRRVPSLEKLQRITGFKPATSLNHIIDFIVARLSLAAESGAPDTRMAVGAAAI
ncbi:MAG: NAD-dependent epimerase/dehydratase family protein [Bryobacteraceae bacterium]